MAKKKPNEWIKKYKPNSDSQFVNADKVLKGLDEIMNALFPAFDKKYIKFYIGTSGLPEEINKNHISHRTIKQILKAGHTDCTFYMFVNPLESFMLDGYKKAYWRNYNTGNWILDLDSCKFDTFDQVVTHLKRVHIPLPTVMIRTSPRSYHLVYQGLSEEWTDELRMRLATRFAEIPDSVTDRKQRDILLREAGVDVGHLKVNFDLQKTRLPFTLNVKRTNASAGTIIVSDYWVNSKVKSEPVIMPAPRLIKPKSYTASQVKKIDFLTNEFASFMNANDSQMLGEILGAGWGKLRFNNCRILQQWWADKFGIAQYALSRKLKKLVETGYLVVVADYKRGKFAKTYGPGDKLIDIMNKRCSKKTGYDFNEPYQNGLTNSHLLADIRQAVYYGWSEDDTTRLILDKQSGRGKDKEKREKDIRYLYKQHTNWMKRQGLFFNHSEVG